MFISPSSKTICSAAFTIDYIILYSCGMRFLRRQLCCTLPSVFLLWLAFYFVCCRSGFKDQFTSKIYFETKQLQGKLQQSKLVCLSSTQAGRCRLQILLVPTANFGT